MTEQHELTADQYKEFVTGSPQGIQYRVHDPVANLSYDFDGFADGRLIWTVADYGRQFDGVGPVEGGIEQAYADTARLQNAVRQGYPIVWCVQTEDDAARLRDVVTDAGISSIAVQHEPPPAGAPRG